MNWITDVALPLAVPVIYVSGWVTAFRITARKAIVEENVPRAQAIRENAFGALIWPIVVLAFPVWFVWHLATRGLPESEREREEKIRRLERALQEDTDEPEERTYGPKNEPPRRRSVDPLDEIRERAHRRAEEIRGEARSLEYRTLTRRMANLSSRETANLIRQHYGADHRGPWSHCRKCQEIETPPSWF